MNKTIDGSDYDGTSQLLTLSQEHVTVSVSVPLVNDSTFEMTETFQARLEFPSVPPERVTIDPASATMSLFDDDDSEFISIIIGAKFT